MRRRGRLADDPAALAKSLENRALVYFSGISFGNSRAGRAAAAARRARRSATPGIADRLRPELSPAAVARCRSRARSDRRGAWQSSTSRCRPSPTSRRCSATPTRRRRPPSGWPRRRRRDRRQEWRGAGAGAAATASTDRRAGRPGRLARRHDRRRRFLQRRLSRRAACRHRAGRGGAQGASGRGGRRAGARRAGAVRDAARQRVRRDLTCRNRYSVVCR